MSTHQTQATPSLHQDLHSKRAYRTKRNRPCALCRSRKISCRREDGDTSCISCRKGNRICSFTDDAQRHLRANDVANAPSNVSGEQHGPPHVADQESDFRWDRNNDLDQEMDYDSLDVSHLELSQILGSPRGLPDLSQREIDSAPWLNTTVQDTTHLDHMPDNLNDLEVVPGIQESMPGVLAEVTEIIHDGNLEDTSFDTARGRSLGMTKQHTFPASLETSSLSETRKKPTSIDQRSDFNSTYFGLSGECDPYLLRHVKYNESDEKPFFKLWYRATETQETTHTILGEKESMQVPVQFGLLSTELVEEIKKTGPRLSPESSQAELDDLVSPEYGRRLVLLFIEYVFPALPVVSRSQLARSSSSLSRPTSQGSITTPPYLVAAIYASALVFGSYDDVLCVSSLYKKPPAEKLWQMAYNGIQSNMHSPTLATVSASLLYLNKIRSGVQQISVDTPFVWTFTASTVALVTSLGLHLDCSSWSIPGWEKRLRRRIWWSAFTEEKWRSLLLGRPSIIARDQWNVADLIEADFEIDHIDKDNSSEHISTEVKAFLAACHSLGINSDKGLLARKLACLTAIADKVYTDLYTIRAAQVLANDFTATINAIRPLQEELASWYSKLPVALQSSKKSTSDMAVLPMPNSVACLHFAYITLEVLLYRALLRPLDGIDFGLDKTTAPENTVFNTMSNGPHFVLPDVHGDASIRTHVVTQVENVISAAEKCAVVVTNFTMELMSWDFAGFWFSWSRIGWATTSSFLALLLVQSPNVEHAMRVKLLMDKWRQILRHQSKSFPDMSLGLSRLDVLYWSDMRKVFRTSEHLNEALSTSGKFIV